MVDLRARLESVSGAEQQLRGEAAAQDAELAATADDLRKMIRENQILNEELQRHGEKAEAQQQQVQRGVSRVAYLEQVVKAHPNPNPNPNPHPNPEP